MTELIIDTKKKTARVRLELLGETDPIEIQINGYRLTPAGDETSLVIDEASASREWLTIALREYVVGQSFTIPAKASTVLKLLA